MQYKGATEFCPVLVWSAWPSHFAPSCFAKSSALSAVFRNLRLAPAFYLFPHNSSPSREDDTFPIHCGPFLEKVFIWPSTTDHFTKVAPRYSCSNLTGLWQSTSSTTWAWLLFNIQGIHCGRCKLCFFGSQAPIWFANVVFMLYA